MGPRLLENYRQRLAACFLNCQVPFETNADGSHFPASVSKSSSLVDLVRQKYAKETCTGREVRETSRLFARTQSISRTHSFSQLQQKIANPGRFSFSQSSLKISDSYGDLGASSSDLGFVSGRNDVGRCTSLGELNQSDAASLNRSSEKVGPELRQSTKSLNIGHKLGSLFNPLRWSRRDLNHSEKTIPTKVTPRYLRKGPAARRCDRSLSSLHRQSVSPASSIFMLPSQGNGGDDTTGASTSDFVCDDQSLPVISGNRNALVNNNSVNLSPRCMRQNNYLLPSQISPNAF